MKLRHAGSVCCVFVFWTAYSQCGILDTSFRCRKLDSKNERKTKLTFSVLDKNLISCAVTCHSNGMCWHFAYNRQNKHCEGYGDGEHGCASGADAGTVATRTFNLMYKHICKKRCTNGEEEGRAGRNTGRAGRNTGRPGRNTGRPGTNTSVRKYKVKSKGKCQPVNIAPDNNAARLRGKCTCKDECKRSRYRLKLNTGKTETQGSKADLVLTVTGTCGEVHRELRNGKDVDLTRGTKSDLRFEEKPVCNVLRVGLAFADCCHEDDWYLQNAILLITMIDYKGCPNALKLYVRSWIGARSGDKRTTGLTCVFGKRSSVSWKNCSPSQRCLES